MKWFAVLSICITVFFAGVLLGEIHTQSRFYAMTGIDFVSFQAAHTNCEDHYQETCKLGAGFVPRSFFE